ncbi:MAG TPA: hypothetical protein VND98_10935 [Solirubrobacterales bacterium]|nr:hypothetical protein [Solirubrobacterales bacterium]
MAEPEPHDFAAADHFLRLVLHKLHVGVALKRLRKRRTKSRSFAAKDILRAADLPCLPFDNEGVAAKLAKVREGKPLAPVMLVRPKSGPLIIADGYHRVSASHILDESTLVHCVLVSVP